ncbi:tRNA(Ile)-lysidine synthase [Burkholderiales bacterium]|nr:tRNA(Ile)-lysidine synthase [Burkholderiales bacterium]
MASSRKRPPKPDPADRALLSVLQRAVAEVPPGATDFDVASIGAARAERARSAAGRRKAASGPALLIAYSGGPDSSVLLDLACRLRDHGVAGFGVLRAVHVHHGLLPEAEDWVAHCEQQCRARNVELVVCRVRVARERGLEAGAREARYEALAQAARACGASAVLTAHNADDRIETFLLQWLRGAGLAGLAGIAERRSLAQTGVRVLRPLLEVSRRDIEAYLVRHGLVVIEDPSNSDVRFARNAIRTQVLPQLAKIRSGFRRSAARSIELVGEAAEVLQELAQEGLEFCTRDAPAGMLRIDRLAALAPARSILVLRAWLAQAGLESPSRARLRDAMTQALGGRGDGRMLIRIGARELRRHRGLLCLRVPGVATRAREQLHWRGEEELAVSTWGGVLRFLPADEAGFDAAWLRELPLEVRARTGGERFKPHATRPSKRLKQLYQEAGVPEFERGALPLLWRDDRLIFVARLGPDARLVERGGDRVRIEWHGETTFLPE